MKKAYKIISVFISVLMMTSCHTSQKINVSGRPGTEIYTPNSLRCGVIPASGTLKVELSDETYYPYLLGKTPGDNYTVPFALDYKKNSHGGAKFAEGAGMSIAVIGGVVEIAGLITIIADSESSIGTALTLGGLGGLGLGAAIGAPASCRLGQDTYKKEVKYIKNQNSNNDLTVTMPVFYNFSEKSFSSTSSPSTKRRAKEAVDTGGSDTSSRRVSSDKSNRSLNDNARKASGTYIGTGDLMQGNESVEHYSELTIVINRISKDVVEVTVFDDNGEDYFGAPAVYSVTKGKNGSFTLTHNKIAKATITIDSKGNIVYRHPRVNIEGDIYILTAKGKLS